MRYYISDLHFYHESLCHQMDKRGFADGKEMNAYMIARWNEKVRAQDEVVILGDLSVGKGKATNAIVEQLNGRLYLIEGNHDAFLQDKQFDRSRFGWIKPYAELYDNKRKVVLSHYPIICYNGQFSRMRDGSARGYMLYGHVHDTEDERMLQRFKQQYREHARAVKMPDRTEKVIQPPCNMINCFCMYSDYQPLSLDEWIENERSRMELSLAQAQQNR